MSIIHNVTMLDRRLNILILGLILKDAFEVSTRAKQSLWNICHNLLIITITFLCSVHSIKE